MKRTAFLIDGFNLYHSTKEIEDKHDSYVKWLDLVGMCKSQLPHIHKTATLASIHYFTAYRDFLFSYDPESVKRHRLYVQCLKAFDVNVVLGRFKSKETFCNKCKKTFTKHEEKETDVSIAVQLIELFVKNECDIVVLITGDTDLVPAIKTARSLFPGKEIIVGFPFGRKNNELVRASNRHFKILKERYESHQFADPLILPDGNVIRKPEEWKKEHPRNANKYEDKIKELTAKYNPKLSS